MNPSTTNPRSPFCLSPSEIEGKLVQAGVLPTAQRIAICRYVLCEADHPSAEEVKAWVDGNFPKMSLATVYNTLAKLAQAGLLQAFRFSHTDKIVYDCNTSKHYHFLDAETQRLTDIPPESVSVEAQLADGLQILDYDIVIRGTTQVRAKS